MTLPLELGQIQDPSARRAFEQISLNLGPGGSGGPPGPTGPAGAPGLNWRGDWSTIDTYAVNDAVYYQGSSYRATVPIAAGGAAPGAPQTVSFKAPTWAAPHVCTRIASSIVTAWTNPTAAEADMAYFFLDVSTGGTLTFDKEAGTNGYMRIYDAAGAQVYAGNADAALTVTVQRYYIRIEPNVTVPESGTLRLTPGTAAVTAGSAWTLVAQGSTAGADANYVYTQGSPSASWTVVHALAKFPAVDVVDSGGSAVIPNVVYLDVNTVRLDFGSPTSGKAFVN